MANSADYAKRHAEAQAITSYRILGREYARIRYGDEVDARDWVAARARQGMSCGDCGVQRGELHLVGCDLEQCPRCHGQAIGCACED
jgi:hypothetical protein